MLGKLKEYVGFINTYLRLARERASAGGWRSAWAFTRCFWGDWYILQQTKSMQEPRVECPICGWTGFDFAMLDCGSFAVPHVECPQCQSHERHRLLHLYLTREQPAYFERPGLVLHFAPEPHVRDLLDRNPNLKRLSTDYAWYMVERYPDRAFQSDMQAMPVADDSLDSLFCLHVLEHVPDDKKGIAELHRILKPGGVAYIMVPFMMGWKETVEFGAPDPAIFDHVRGYAPSDFSDRLGAFEWEAVRASTFLTAQEARRFSIPDDSQVVFRCVKR